LRRGVHRILSEGHGWPEAGESEGHQATLRLM
jgi:hypothetical protein